MVDIRNKKKEEKNNLINSITKIFKSEGLKKYSHKQNSENKVIGKSKVKSSNETVFSLIISSELIFNYFV